MSETVCSLKIRNRQLGGVRREVQNSTLPLSYVSLPLALIRRANNREVVVALLDVCHAYRNVNESIATAFLTKSFTSSITWINSHINRVSRVIFCV